MGFPPPPVSTIDWPNQGFLVTEVNGHMESHYSVKTGVWSSPKFVTDPFLRLHGMAPALNYGQQAYEGLKAFRTPDGSIKIFRPQKNAARMNHTVSYISIPPIPKETFIEAVHAVVSLNAEYVPPHSTGAALYIRAVIFGSSAQLGLNPPEEYTFVVYALPVGVYHGSKPVPALILEDFDRAAPYGTGSAKVGGNYAPVLPHSQKAYGEGFGITLHLDSKTRSEIDEFSTSGFIGIKKASDGQVTFVVPNSKSAIDSVTSDSCFELAKSFGWKTEKRSVKYEELPEFTEVMAAGTAAALVAVSSITRRSTNDKFEYMPEGCTEIGEACEKLLRTLKGVQEGKIEDQFGWMLPVKEVDSTKYTDRGENEVKGESVDQLP